MITQINPERVQDVDSQKFCGPGPLPVGHHLMKTSTASTA